MAQLTDANRVVDGDPERADSESLGYCRPWVVAPGGRVCLHASLARAAEIDIVRIACANAEGVPGIGPAARIEPVNGAPTWSLERRVQPLVPGARLTVSLPAGDERAGWVLVFALQRGARGRGGHVLTLADCRGSGLRVGLSPDAGRTAHLTIDRVEAGVDAAPAARVPVEIGPWSLFALQLQPAAPGRTGSLRLRHATCDAALPGPCLTPWSEPCPELPWPPCGAPARLCIGTRAAGEPGADFRIDLVSWLPSAEWPDLTPEMLLATGAPELREATWERRVAGGGAACCLLRASCQGDGDVVDIAGQASVTTVQRPYVAVRGARWDGRSQDPRSAPTHYSALHFNSDTLLDAGWEGGPAWTVPPDLPSGCYAFRWRTRGDDGPGYASFFVSGARRPRHRIAMLVPTFTYLAYANAPEDMRGPTPAGVSRLAEARLDRIHPAAGRSLYERHPDGHGVLYSGTRRPLLNVTPDHRPWGFVADTWLRDWLERAGFAHDVITDHDLHAMGEAALAPFDVIVTGHHPEYWSTAMWDGLWRHLDGGGRLLYLGGNGFYWRTAVDADGDLIEVRRAEDGTRPSIAPPGEFHCAFGGEYGGLWRRLGRAPQHLVGVGMAAQGFVRATHFRKCADAFAPAVGFVFDGVEDAVFGAHGALGGGASGWEIDRIDHDLGSPPGTWWLAQSEKHDPSMLRTKEELLSYVTPFRDSKARSDVALVPIGRGDVFSVGSMTWVGSLHGAHGVTDVARITDNVIRRFLDPEPIPRKRDHPE